MYQICKGDKFPWNQMLRAHLWNKTKKKIIWKHLHYKEKNKSKIEHNKSDRTINYVPTFVYRHLYILRSFVKHILLRLSHFCVENIPYVYVYKTAPLFFALKKNLKKN